MRLRGGPRPGPGRTGTGIGTGGADSHGLSPTALSTLLLVAGCAPGGDEINLGHATYAAAFTVTVGDFSLRPASTLFRVADGRLVDQPSIFASESESGVVGLTGEQVEAMTPFMTSADATRGELAIGDPECAVRVDRSRGSVRAAIPGSAAFHSPDGLVRELSEMPPLTLPALEAPLSESRCVRWARPLSHVGGVRPFREGTIVGGRARSLGRDSSSLLPTFQRVSRLPDGRVLALGRRDLLLVEPGRPFEESDRSSLRVPLLRAPNAPDAEGWGVAADARDPDRVIVIVAASHVERGLGVHGSYFRTTLGRDGFTGELVLTASASSGLRDVAIDPRGRVLAVGDAGIAMTASSALARPVESRVARVDLARVVATGDELEPFAVAGGGGALVGDPFGAGLEYSDLGADRVNSVAAVETDEGLEIWVVDSEGLLKVRRPGSHGFVLALRADLVAGAAHCAPAADACGHVGLSNRPNDLKVLARGAERWVAVALRRCGTLTILHSNGCGVLLPSPDEVTDDDELTAIDLRHGMLTTAGWLSRVLEIPIDGLIWPGP